MKITANQYAKTLYEVTKDKSQKEISGLVSSFVEVLNKNRQMKLMPKIFEKFKEIWNKENGIVEAEITTKFEIVDMELRKIENFIKEKYSAKKVEITNVIDEKIKGGIIIKIGDEILDGSVIGQLKKMENNLIN